MKTLSGFHEAKSLAGVHTAASPIQGTSTWKPSLPGLMKVNTGVAIKGAECVLFYYLFIFYFIFRDDDLGNVMLSAHS